MGCLFNKKKNAKISSIKIDLDNWNKKTNIGFFCHKCKNPIEISKIHSESKYIVFKCQCENKEEKYHEFSDFSIKKIKDEKIEDNNISLNSSDKNMLADKNNMLEEIVKLNDKIVNAYEKYPNNYFHLASLKNVAESFIEQTERDSEELDWHIKGMQTKNKKQEEVKNRLNNKYGIKVTGEEEGLYFSWYENEEKNEEKKIDDKIFRLLSKIIFVQLKEIDLSGNKIKKTEYLYNMSLPFLEILDMSHNEIEDIEPIAELNCKELKELCLQYNKIENFEPFLNSNFPELEIFRIEGNNEDKSKNNEIQKKYKNSLNNKIRTVKEFDDDYNLDILSEDKDKKKKNKKNDNSNKEEKENEFKKQLEKLKEVKKLYLYDLEKKGNQIIKDLYYLIPKENKIELLKIDNNEIDDVSLLTRIPLYHLKELDLSLNNIKNLNFLSKLRFNKLTRLYLNHNKIYNIYPLNKLKEKEKKENTEDFFFPDLKMLSLNKNPFDDTNKDNFEILTNIKNMRKEEFFIDIYPDEKNYGHFENEIEI